MDTPKTETKFEKRNHTVKYAKLPKTPQSFVGDGCLPWDWKCRDGLYYPCMITVDGTPQVMKSYMEHYQAINSRCMEYYRKFGKSITKHSL